MRHFLLTVIFMMAATSMTVRDQMTVLNEIFGVNFVYDSSLDLDVRYEGKSMEDLVKDGADLGRCLQTLLDGTDIDYEINRKYVVLTRKGSKKKPKNYAVLIEEQHDTLSESRITAIVDRQRNATQTGMKKIDGSGFRASAAPLAQPDVVKTLQQLPGVAAGTEMLSGMYVHGGTGTDNLFLLDGVPLYQVSHLAGLFSSFNTEIIDHLDFYKSGFPARYGGKMSSVVDVTTKEGNMQEYHGMFSVGLINGTLQFEGPVVKGKTSFNVAMRRSWLDILSVPTLAILNRNVFSPEKEVDVRYAMTDLNASVTHLFSKDNQLSLNVYTGRDLLDVVWMENTVEYWEGERFPGKNGNEIGVAWGNVLASLNWKYKISDKFHTNVIGYYTNSNNKVDYLLNSWDFSAKIIEENTQKEHNRSLLHDVGVKADFNHILSGHHHMRFGADAVFHIYYPSRSISNIYSITGMNPSKTEESVSYRFFGNEIGVYFEDEMSYGDWFRTNIGLRYTMFNVKDRTYHSVDPRIAFRFQCGSRTAIKMSYSEMSQFSHEVRSMTLDLPLTLWMPSTSKVAPMKSRQFALGVAADLPYNLFLNVEGYVKTMSNIMEYMGTSQFFPPVNDWERSYVSGEGLAYGVETEFAWRTRKTDISAFYTLSWSKRRFKEFFHDWYPDRYDNRHKLTIAASHKFSDRFDIYASWNWHSGNRITVVSHSLPHEGYDPHDGFGRPHDFHDTPNNMKLPDYHRLDLGANFRKTTKRGNESIWTISIYNTYCRMNPIWADIWLSTDDVKGYKCKAYAVVPIIPMFSYTLRF